MDTEENKQPEDETNEDASFASDVADAYEGADNLENEKFGDAPADQATAHEVLVKLQEENAKLKDQVLRALAEAENTRKRAERSQADARNFAVTGFAKDMLDIADNMRRAIEAVPEEAKNDDLLKTLLEGIEATQRVMLQTFGKHGIELLAPEEGKFDPNFHEVMFEADMPDKKPGEIIQLIEPGYTLNGRLLRPARVGVAKGGTAEIKVDQEV